MKYRISKIFYFEAAHRLIKNYSGKCTNNHGHSFRVEVTLEAKELDERDMLIDFKELKPLKDWIDNVLDHTTILWKEDPMVDFIKTSGQRLYITESSPTSEVIAKVIFKEAQKMFENERVKVACVEINETCTSAAKVLPA